MYWGVENPDRPNAPRLGGNWMRRGAVLAVLVGGAIILGAVGHAHYPIQHWLFWRFAAYWLISALWAFSCLSAGYWVLRKWCGPSLSAAEFLLASFAVGVLVFFLVMFAGGLVHVFSPGFALAWPVVACLAGGRHAFRYVRRMARVTLAPKFIAPERLVIGGFGVLGVAMVYFTIIPPENVGFDARWYHLPIAEHFVAARGVVPFLEGWYQGTYPHLASIVYTWAFLLPGTELLDRILLAAHLEFFIFIVTLGSIPLLVRKLVGGPLLRWESFAALFLFPTVLLYDGSLFVAADHVLAFWAIPIYLSLLRSLRALTWRRLAVTSALLAGALLTKYQAVYFLAPCACAVLVAWFRATRSGRGREATFAIGAATALGLALTAPHWLFNWFWYGDPLYPLLHAYLPSRPFSDGTARQLDTFLGTKMWVPEGSTFSKLAEAARALFTFSFEPHDWPTYHGAVPVFGSLFTILSVIVLFLPAARRVAPLVGATLMGIGIWFLTSHQDRYLQALIPWMAGATYALAYLVHRQLPSLRAALWLLVGLQVVWGGDVYFMPSNDQSHEVDRPSPIKAAVDFLSAGYKGRYEDRLHPFPPWESIGASLPHDAKVLLHERYLRLGLGRMAASDLPGWQGGISYVELGDSRKIAERLRGFGITHVLWETATSHELDSVASDVAFFRFATQWTEEPKTIGPFTVAVLAPHVPSAEESNVAWYDCPPDRGALIRLEDLDTEQTRIQENRATVQITSIPPLDGTSEPPREVDAAVVNRDCHGGSPPQNWDVGAHRRNYALWFRRAPHRTERASARVRTTAQP
jgi:hypothetical protein